jgi:hypothetical protein
VQTNRDFGTQPDEVLCNAQGNQSIPLALRYNHCLKGGQLLAVADEEGVVSILDTSTHPPEQLWMTDVPGNSSAERPEPLGQWIAHNNAIFQLEWIKVSSAAVKHHLCQGNEKTYCS